MLDLDSKCELRCRCGALFEGVLADALHLGWIISEHPERGVSATCPNESAERTIFNADVNSFLNKRDNN